MNKVQTHNHDLIRVGKRTGVCRACGKIVLLAMFPGPKSKKFRGLVCKRN